MTEQQTKQIEPIPNITNFDLNNADQCRQIPGKMNSPRTLEAMKILGLEATELLPISYDNVKQYFIQRDRTADIPKDLIDLRYKMLNDRRFTK